MTCRLLRTEKVSRTSITSVLIRMGFGLINYQHLSKSLNSSCTNFIFDEYACTEPDGDERWKQVKDAVADDPKARARINAYLFDLERALEEVKDCLMYTERMVRAPTPTGPRTESGPDGYAKLLNSCQDSVDTIRNLEKQICTETGLPSLDLSEVQLIYCKFKIR